MSKRIKMVPELKAQLIEEFTALLDKTKVADGKISFTKTFNIVDRKATVYFTELAWSKMTALLRGFDKEVAWHGVASRGDNPDKDEYYITDILVYPQEVTGVTVSMDEAEYAKWLCENGEDERFYNIGMQGHSHVNMNVTPSGTDLIHQDTILSQLSDNQFYIFIIMNKRHDKYIRIFDLEKNVLFETFDVTVEIIDDGNGIESFLKQAKAMVKDKKTTPTNNINSNSSFGSEDWYNQNYGNIYNLSSKNQNQLGNNSTDKKENDNKENFPPRSNHKGKRRGKRKK